MDFKKTDVEVHTRRTHATSRYKHETDSGKLDENQQDTDEQSRHKLRSQNSNENGQNRQCNHVGHKGHRNRDVTRQPSSHPGRCTPNTVLGFGRFVIGRPLSPTPPSKNVSLGVGADKNEGVGVGEDPIDLP